jgi:hypothetical protein
MSSPNELPNQESLHELAAALREATCAALERRWMLAQKLDESRSEIERLLMLREIDPAESRRVVQRAQVMLDAWRSLAGSQAADGG